MIEYSLETDIDHSPAKVWAVLSIFEEHKLWNPYAHVQRKRADTGAFDYGWRVNPRSLRYLEVSSRLIAEDFEKLLSFEVRPNFLFAFEERYTLERIPGGTRLVHSYSCRGPLAALRLPGIRKSFETMLRTVEQGLHQYLKQTRKPTQPRPHARSGLRKLRR